MRETSDDLNLLLIEDNPADVFFVKKMLLTLLFPSAIFMKRIALKKVATFSKTLVFLDINMPAMDGWEFLDLMDVFNTRRKNKAVTIMLTTSLNPQDEVRSKSMKQVSGYRRKPLSRQMMDEILDQYFAS